jgi:hypothetical protein
MIPCMYKYPQGTIQTVVPEWWIKKGNIGAAEQWDLLVALVPFFGNVPCRADAERVDPHNHEVPRAKLKPFHIKNQKKSNAGLPVAALPDGSIVYSGKVRPVLVVAPPYGKVPRKVTGGSRAMFKPVILTAPYYGAEPDGTRGGLPRRIY